MKEKQNKNNMIKRKVLIIISILDVSTYKYLILLRRLENS
jgi:hypothetical protein